MYGVSTPPLLRSMLSQATADSSLFEHTEGPHHPISCVNEDSLKLLEDGTMTCFHSTASPECPRNQVIIDTSIAILIIEEAVRKFDAPRET